MNEPAQSGRLGLFRGRGQGTKGDEGGGPRLDPVTGIPGRDGLLGLVEQATAKSRPSSTLSMIAFVDVGHLRDVNDSLGPDVGDLLLRLVADRLATIDVPGTKLLRYGGAELALVFEQIPNAAGGDEIGRFLVELLSAPFDVGVESVTIDVHVGAAVSADNYETLEDMIRDGHQALVAARESGRATYVIHDESKRARYSTRIDDRRLHQAIENDEFSLHYQPIVRIDNGEMIGVEALIRWTMPGATNTGILYPHDFLPLLEKTGLIVNVGRWVIDEACRQAAEWSAAHPEQRRLFVTCNLGARQLAEAGFRDTVQTALADHAIEPWQLCLDITEAALRYNQESTWASLRDLKDQGVKLGLDDFGTGVSSLVYLREFSLDVIRIDRTFVGGLGMSQEDLVIVRHIAGLAHDLGCVVIAEGVETPEQAALLAELQVDLGQGFHFARPEVPEQIDHRLRPEGEEVEQSRWETKSVLDFEPD